MVAWKNRNEEKRKKIKRNKGKNILLRNKKLVSVEVITTFGKIFIFGICFWLCSLWVKHCCLPLRSRGTARGNGSVSNLPLYGGVS